MHATRRRGFSLIELLIVIAIMAALSGSAMLRIDWIGTEARDAAVSHNRRVIQKAIDEFHADRRRYPASLEELVQTRYLREVPVDPTSRERDTWTLIPSTTGARDVCDVRPLREVAR